jgi:uncharacterized membrane protein
MNKTRLEAFSDGVIAIIITIMVLELKVPEGASWQALKPMATVFMSYVLSFLFIGIYWVNHHHLLHTVKRINPAIMWANINLLFWLSLVPFATNWMGINHFLPFTISLYAVLLLLCGAAFTILQNCIEKSLGDNSNFKEAIKNMNKKGTLSIIFYSAAIPLAYVHPAISGLLFLSVSAMWMVPDKNIEKIVSNE